MPLREVRSDTHLEVDLMILDFLAYESTQALVDEARNRRGARGDPGESSAEDRVNLYRCFLPIFHCRHPDEDDIPEAVCFRTLVIKFASLHLQRFSRHLSQQEREDLENMRLTHRQRAQAWWQSTSHQLNMHASWTSELPVSAADRARVYLRVKDELCLDSASAQSLGHPTSVALVDVLPVFMEISAALQQNHGKQNANINQGWMRLAAEFMIQAVLEQWLLIGSKGPETLENVFAWGFQPQLEHHSPWRADEIVNDMFCDDETGREVEGWEEMRQSALELLQPPDGTPLIRHLEDLAARLPLATFADQILNFIEALQRSQEKPFLVQVELGEVEGVPPEEVEEIRKRVRWPDQQD